MASDTGAPRVEASGAETRSSANLMPARKTGPQIGVRLIREWNGKTNVVDVVETGFQYESETYGSLSAIARKITGAHWSGPRFFGL